MNEFLNNLVEYVNDFLQARPGVLPLVGVAFIVLNLVLQLFRSADLWLIDSHLFLHIGLVISIIGMLVINVYRH